MNTYRRVRRGAEMMHPYWVVLPEDRCTGQNFYLLRAFCTERGLSLSRHGRSIPRREGYYQVFMFAEEAYAECSAKSLRRAHACQLPTQAP